MHILNLIVLWIGWANVVFWSLIWTIGLYSRHRQRKGPRHAKTLPLS